MYMRSFLRKLIIHLLIVVVLLNLIAFGSLWALRNASFYKPGFLINGFGKGTEFDYVVLGSSRGLTTLDTKLIDDSLKAKGINLSMDDTGIGSHYLMLKHFIESGYATGCVILNIEPWNSREKVSVLNNNDYRFAPFIYETYVHDYFQRVEKRRFSLKTRQVFSINGNCKI